VIHWLGTLPNGLVFVLFGALAIGLTVLFDVIVRRYVRPETRQRASTTASVTLQVTATIYAILIAFVIVDAYSQVRDSQSDVSSKAASLAVIYENGRGLPEPGAREIQRAAIAYARAVVQRGIPALQDSGDPDRRTDLQLEKLFTTIESVDPRDENDRVAYAASVRALDNVVATRAKLLDAARPTIPDELIFLLVVIGLVIMAVATLLDTQHRRSHLFILSALALVVWLTIALVISMDYPFAGLLRVTDAPLREFVHFRAAR
jgi:Protein of unknown function (DUF4239)